MNTDHVVGLELVLRCHHCSQNQTVRPMPLAHMSDVLRGFLLGHRRCEPIPVPSPQLQLPATEGDNCEPPGPSMFERLYPHARTHNNLRNDLRAALPAEDYAKLPDGTVEQWHPSSGVFEAVSFWSRVTIAHAASELRARRGEPGISGLYVPAQEPMPEPLAALLAGAKPKKTRGTRKKRRDTLDTPERAS